MKTLKQMIGSKDVVLASQLAKNKTAVEAQERAFEEAAGSEEFRRKTKIPKGRVESWGYWTRERFIED